MKWVLDTDSPDRFRYYRVAAYLLALAGAGVILTWVWS
jgi:hypothetical protein